MTLLTLLVLIPVLGSAAVAVMGRARGSIRNAVAVVFSVAHLGLASWVLWASASSHTSPSQMASWTPALGVSILLHGDELTLVLVVWIALSTTLTLALTRPRVSTASWILFLEATVIASFLAQDVFLIFAGFGGTAIAIAQLSGTPRKLLAIESAGLALLFGWFAVIYRMVYAQTGFVSTELARWQALVVYPDEARSLLLFGSSGMVWMMLALAFAMKTAPRAGRLVLSATFLLFGSNFLFRILMPLSATGAQTVASAVLAFATLLMASTFFARGWIGVAVGYQGLVLFGLFSWREEAVAGALMMMVAAAVGVFGVRLTKTATVVWFFVAFLIGLPLATVIAPAWSGDRVFAALASVSFALLTYRMVALAFAIQKTTPDAAEGLDEAARRRGVWLALPIVLWSLSMIVGWSAWESGVTPWAQALTQQSTYEPLP